jgi:hypothetical protein
MDFSLFLCNPFSSYPPLPKKCKKKKKKMGSGFSNHVMKRRERISMKYKKKNSPENINKGPKQRGHQETSSMLNITSPPFPPILFGNIGGLLCESRFPILIPSQFPVRSTSSPFSQACAVTSFFRSCWADGRLGKKKRQLNARESSSISRKKKTHTSESQSLVRDQGQGEVNE